MARLQHSPPYVLAYFVDGPYAGTERMIAPAADGSPRPRVTLPDPAKAAGTPGVTYERTSWGDLSEAVRYRVAPT